MGVPFEAIPLARGGARVNLTQGSHVTIVNRGAAVVALHASGTSSSSDYGGTRSGWIRVPPGETVLDRCVSDG